MVTVVFATSGVTPALGATALPVFGLSGASLPATVVAGVLAALTDAQATSARSLAVADISTVVVPSTITAYASETLFMHDWMWLTHRRLWAIVAIVAGALMMKIQIMFRCTSPRGRTGRSCTRSSAG